MKGGMLFIFVCIFSVSWYPENCLKVSKRLWSAYNINSVPAAGIQIVNSPDHIAETFLYQESDQFRMRPLYYRIRIKYRYLYGYNIMGCVARLLKLGILFLIFYEIKIRTCEEWYSIKNAKLACWQATQWNGTAWSNIRCAVGGIQDTIHSRGLRSARPENCYNSQRTGDGTRRP